MHHTQALLKKPAYRTAVVVWLALIVLLIYAMVALGGYTRLSGSGLSITEWKPIHGVLPPMNEAEWQEEFTKYQQIPQYRQVNPDMNLQEFKAIYWPEFWHRNLGRLIGVIFALPLIFFALRGVFSRRIFAYLVALFILGGVQGLIGWIMVASGLKNLTYVSHIKLALHLSFALLLFAIILWLALKIWDDGRKIESPLISSHILKFYAALPMMIYLQIILGALLAGLHGGLIYNTFPDMNGYLISPDIHNFQGSALENIPLIQFLHRYTAKVIVFYFLWWSFVYRRNALLRAQRRWQWAFALILFMQFALGVLTLVNAAPLALALKHQLCAVLLFATALFFGYKLKSGLVASQPAPEESSDKNAKAL